MVCRNPHDNDLFVFPANATPKSVEFNLGTSTSPAASNSSVSWATTKPAESKEKALGFTFSTTPNISSTGDKEKERPKAEVHKTTQGKGPTLFFLNQID